jgi:SAM-dependent methyltransferase
MLVSHFGLTDRHGNALRVTSYAMSSACRSCRPRMRTSPMISTDLVGTAIQYWGCDRGFERERADRAHEFFDRKWRKLRARAEQRLRPITLKSRGFCPICERGSTFISRDPWLRDHFKCTRCRSIPRERALMLVLQQRVPNWRNLTLHESSPGRRGASRRFAEECRDYVPTHFYEGKTAGSMVGEYRCENLEELTFPDNSIDVHVTQDVLEHVLRPNKAFAEIARTLKPGGAHIFTVPLVKKESPSCMRVDVAESGEVIHLVPEISRKPN